MPTDQECQQMAQISMNTVLRAVLLFTTICCFFCIPMAFYSLYRIKNSVKLHFNSKCIFLTHNFAVLFHCTIRIILHGKDLINYFGPWTNGCEIMPSRARCDLRVLYKISQYVIEITPFILTVERFMATFRARRYENRYKWLGVLLFGVHISLAELMVIIQNSTKEGDAIIYYCWLSSTGNRYSLNFSVVFIFTSQLATIPALLYILKKNERYRETSLQQCATLTQRYQIFENLRTLNMFRVMSVVTWVYITYDASLTFVAHFYLGEMSMGNQFATVEVIHCLPLYFIVLSLLVLRVDRQPRSQFAIKTDKYQPHYFNDLQKFFDEAFEKIHLRKHRISPK